MSATANGAPKPTQSEDKAAGARRDRNTALMQAMGSQDGMWSPEARDWWLYEIRHAKSADTRLMALLKSCTVARRYPKPYATDDMGKPIDYAYIASRLTWTERTARNEMTNLVNQGRARIDEQGRFWLSADVPMAHMAPDDTEAASDSGSAESWDDFVQSHFSGYLADSVRALPASKREPFIRKYTAFARYRPDVAAEAMAAARLITERYEDTILDEFGVKKNRLTKRRDPEFKWLKVEEKAAPDFVQSQTPVCTHPETVPYKPENGNVQSEASLFTLQNQKQKGSGRSVEKVDGVGKPSPTDRPTAPTPPTPIQAPRLVEEDLTPVFDSFDAVQLVVANRDVQDLVAACRSAVPDVPLEEIAAAVRDRGAEICKSRTIRKPVGFLLSDIPALLSSESARLRRERVKRAAEREASLREEEIDGFRRDMEAAAADPDHPDHAFARAYLRRAAC